MKAVLTPDEMGDADRRTSAAGTPVEVLMDRAGRAVAWAARHMLGGIYGRRVVVLCGKGNNGGDGLVAACVLRRWGMHVTAVEALAVLDWTRVTNAIRRADLVIDAIFGTGLHGGLAPEVAILAETALMYGVPVLAVDIPSGVDGLTGAVETEAFTAERTVTFAAYKPGLLFEPGRSRAGQVTVADIGVDVSDARSALTEETDVRAWLPARAATAHKWSVGGVMVVGGSTGMTGAALLVSRAAMRAGAGIVWCGVPGVAAAAAASGSEVITRALPATPEGALDAPAAARVRRDLERFGALVVGPGLGRDDRTRAAVCELVAEAPVALVLDADGLNALGGELAPLRVRGAALRAPTVLTPHDGEYARLMGSPPGPDRVAAARALADAAGAVVLLKGVTTVIAEPGGQGRVAINPTGGPWLASAGTGDVLSGVVGAFLARGAAAFEAAAAGAWVHGRAADLAGHTGLVAGDLVAAIPEILEE